MDIKKFVDVAVQDTSVHMHVPFLKVDAEKRLVSGFATLDNIDKQGHVVDFDGSVEAFAKWRRNIREMHGNDAIGKAVDIEARPYYDPETDRMYNGIYLTVYVSKTAEEAWTKVLEGIYTGFSIGGRIVEKDEGYDAERDEWYVLIKKYELVEVSLVDTPANPLANIYSVQKADNGSFRMMVDGEESNVLKTQNVMFCSTCKCASFDSDKCPSCNGVVKGIGWVEDTSDKKDEVKKMLAAFLAEEPNDQGGVIVTKNETVEAPAEEVTEVVEKAEETAVEAEETVTTEETVEAAEVVEEEEAEAPVEETIEASDSVDVDALVEKVAARVAEMLKADVVEPEAEVTEEVEKTDDVAPAEDAVAKALEALGSQLAEIGKSLDGLGERVEAVEATTAGKKSKDINKSDDVEDESFWQGSFLN